MMTFNAIVFIALGIAFAIYGPLLMAFLNVPELNIEQPPTGTSPPLAACSARRCLALVS